MPTVNQVTFHRVNNPVKYAHMLSALDSIDPTQEARCSYVYEASATRQRVSDTMKGTITECIAFIESVFHEEAMRWAHVVLTR